MSRPVQSSQVRKCRWRPQTVLTVFLALLVVPGGICHARAERAGARASVGDLGDLLSAPMPGTRARADADQAARLEGALPGFDGVDRAHVIISRRQDDGAQSPEVAVQLQLREGFSPTPAWLSTLCAFAFRTVPDLDENSLTIVDSAGRTLHEAGASLIAAPPARPSPGTGVLDETFRFDPGWLWAAAGLGFLLVVAGLAVQLLLRRGPEVEEPVDVAGPLDFLAGIPVDRLVDVLRDERPEVLAAVVSLAPEAVAERLRRHEALPERIPALTEQLAPDLTEALARELRARLVRT